ncbi:Adipocyte plasma membrane-associated protein, putative [Ricinus communis]|uniref:Adipocyte plasma membrane-associated protein, putative n=1 Tax=Ricinus communis TaxID=3988 RepID=B9S6S5_RICCO|nr:Adipocyte plasma membrane-associated protein, putative [Ricinus communis]|eukprot:XP_002521694.1 protein STRICTOSIDINE SYNTHASE-LIKE 5 [Ricinus communis]
MPTESTAESISKKFSWLCYTVTFSLIIPILAAILVYQLDSFESAPMPIHELTHPLPTPTMKNDHILKGSEFLGVGQLLAPEDIVYDTGSKVIYTGCVDGWIKRVTINDSVADSVVENWVHTGGRPLGLALGHRGEVIVADAYKGLLKISRNGAVELLTDEAEGVKFKLTDGVAVAEDGTIYFTDASHKYDLHDCMWDILEGEPHGRLLSYDPSTKKTQVLVHHLYFANGIAISPDQDYLVFSETPMGRCKKYYIHGNKKGRIEKFIDLPGLLDNIHYDGHGHFWIASATVIIIFVSIMYIYLAIISYDRPIR